MERVSECMLCIDIKLKFNQGYCRENTGIGGRRDRGKKMWPDMDVHGGDDHL